MNKMMDPYLRIIFTVTVSSVLIHNLPSISGCETKFLHVFNDSSFYFNESFLGTFQESLEYCESLGSTLASIHSHEENEFINHQLGFVKTWIGLRRTEKNASFSWVDSSAFDYNRTLPKNLNNNYDCPKSSCCIYHTVLTRFFNRFGTYVEVWKQGSCDRLLGAVCRRPAIQSDFNLSPASCDQLFNHVHHGLSYHYNPSLNMTFKAAQSYCKSLGSSLPTIQTRAQNEYLQFLVRNNEVWLGSTEVVAGKHVSFSWSDGSSMNYTNFAAKSNKAACNYFKCRGFVNRRGKWSGISIFAHLGVVCQKSVPDEDENHDHSHDYILNSSIGSVPGDQSDTHSVTGNMHSPSCCPAVFPHLWNGKRYHFNPGMKGSLNQSMSYCKSLGSTIATVDSMEENNFIHSTVANKAKVWLSAKANLLNSRFEYWTDGNRINFTKWYRKELICTSRCCGIILDTDNTWMSDECSSLHNVVCVKDAAECKTSNPSECDDLFTHSFRGKSYYHAKGLLKSWNESKVFCDELNSDLGTITSKRQNLFLSNMVAKDSSDLVWLSAQKRQFLSYLWPNGDSLVYSNWGPASPSCSDSCCGITFNPADAQWFDVNCTEKHGIICEKDTGSMIGRLTFVTSSNRGSREEAPDLVDGGEKKEAVFIEETSPQIIAKIAVLEAKIHKIQDEIASKYNFFLEGSKKSEGAIKVLSTNLEKLMNRVEEIRGEEKEKMERASQRGGGKTERKGGGEEEEEVEVLKEGESRKEKDERRKRELSETSPLYQNYYIYAGIGSIVLFLILLSQCKLPCH